MNWLTRATTPRALPLKRNISPSASARRLNRREQNERYRSTGLCRSRRGARPGRPLVVAQRPVGLVPAPAAAERIRPVVILPRLLAASERVADDTDPAEDLRLLLAPGSSLGGARPKAAVRERDGQLAIAKFPHKDDYAD